VEIIKRSALVPYSAEQMYLLVDDVEKYPQFVPYCRRALIMERTGSVVSAKLDVAKSGIARSFSTRNTLNEFHSIHMELIEGPFTRLSGGWYFKALAPNASKIELELEYAFSNRLASIAFAKMFNHLVQSMITAFSERAETIYGSSINN